MCTETNPAREGQGDPAGQDAAPPSPSVPAELSPLETPAEPLLPPGEVPLVLPSQAETQGPLPQTARASETIAQGGSAVSAAAPGAEEAAPAAAETAPNATSGRTASEEPVEVHPVAPVPVAGRHHVAERLQPRIPLFRHYRRTIGWTILLFVAVATAGWLCRTRVLVELVLEIHSVRLSEGIAKDLAPPLMETLRHDRLPARRQRAAVLLGIWGEDVPPRVSDALFEALKDPDRSVEEAAWESLEGLNSPLRGYVSARHSFGCVWSCLQKPARECVEVLRRAVSPNVRKALLDAMVRSNAPACWPTARWALENERDPQVIDPVLAPTRFRLYREPGRGRSPEEDAFVDCLMAGLCNANPRIRDRCRRLVIDYARDKVSDKDIHDWILTTRDVDTVERLFFLSIGRPESRGLDALEERLAEEQDFNTAVDLSIRVMRVAPDLDERDQRKLCRAGLKNPDPKIRDYFQTLLDSPPPPPHVPEEPKEPEDGR